MIIVFLRAIRYFPNGFYTQKSIKMKQNKIYTLLLFISLIIGFPNFTLGGDVLYSFPFKIKGNRIFVKGKINNKACTFLYDTGQGQFGIGEVFFKSLNIKKHMPIKIELAEKYKQTITKYNTQEILKFTPDANYSAIINIEFFSDYLVKIDYKNKKIDLYNKEEIINNEKPIVANLTINRKQLTLYGFFYTKARLNICDTVIEGNFLIDTGSGRYVTILNYEKRLNPLKEKLKKKKNYFEAKSNEIHINSLNQSLFIKDNRFFIGNKSYDNTIVDITDTNTKYYPRHSLTGIIGGGFLKQFTLHNNYKKNSLVIEESSISSQPDKLYSDGIKFMKKGRKLMVFAILTSTQTKNKTVAR